MKTWVLLVLFVCVKEIVADDSDLVECRSIWCTPLNKTKQIINGKMVCCSPLLHSYMVVKTEQQGRKNVMKCYCKPNPIECIG
ncbi:hypothetical protein RRG08_044570 [Elysia crispata]|uniref:Uncharacterized protein n=1 Tax=Elysia crispata TaxID=231223 RepID=A0AAE1DLU1_9GAST|nr:hypothetical protein RRG08_044570 [Elysia crispata]